MSKQMTVSEIHEFIMSNKELNGRGFSELCKTLDPINRVNVEDFVSIVADLTETSYKSGARDFKEYLKRKYKVE